MLSAVIDKQPPQSLEAERSVLGSIIIDNEALVELDGLLRAEHFYKEGHRKIWAGMQRLHRAGSPIDLVTLTEDLRMAGDLARIGSAPYLVALADHVPVSAYAFDYARIVAEKHRAREIIALAAQLMQAAHDSDELDDVLTRHEAALTTLSRFQALERGPSDYYQGAVDTFDGIGGLTTGFPSLDGVSGGLVKGGYNVIAARPSMGKSAAARSILTHRVKQGDRVALFSIDQSGDDIYALEAAKQVFVPITSFRRDRNGRQRATSENIAKAKERAAWLRDEWSKNFIIHDSRAELASILSKAKHEIRAGASVIAIDHLQSVMVEGRGDDTSSASAVSRAFKAMSREYNVTLLLLSQLNRSVESRENKRPVLKDLRQTGAIEEDANQIMFVYRDDYYAGLEGRASEAPGIGEIIVAKNKLGPVPETAELTWVGRYASFEEKGSL